MKTIEVAAREYSESREDNDYTVETEMAFEAGVRFAQRWIPIEEELPNRKNGQINKEVIALTSYDCAYIIIYDDYLGWIPNGTDVDVNSIKSWRPIELKS